MQTRNYDALVVGSGFGGIYACYTLREMGLSFACVDNAGDVGGTWYWNRYPGAMSDTHSHLYRFSWDEEDYKSQSQDLLQNYSFQPEIEKYLQNVVRRHDLRQFMQFNTEVVSAVFDEHTNTWTVTTSTHNTTNTYVVRYLITAMGLLSQPVLPDIPGLSQFRGQVIHSFRWKDDIDLKGKRVAILGNGSTGVQIIATIASEVGSLICFTRNPQYVVPAGLSAFTDEDRNGFNTNFTQQWQEARDSAMAFGFQAPTRSFAEATLEEREQVFEDLWQQGNGVRFMMCGFTDITTSLEANDWVAEFVRRKIRQIVVDPEKARILCPTEYYARRPICGVDYYEQFNRDNVHLVDVKQTPITEVTANAIRVQGKDGVTEHEVDAIILATGFDALDGNYTRLHIQGRAGHTIREHWSKTITSFGGVALSQFPNMFMILGPQSPFTNNPPCIEAQMDLIKALIQRSETLRHDGKKGVVEVEPELEANWAQRCEDAVQGSLFQKTSSWIFGSNVPGKVYATRFFFPGLGTYRQITRDLVSRNCEGFTFL